MLLNCYKVRVMTPVKETKLAPQGHSKLKYFSVQLVPEIADDFGKPYSLTIFETGQFKELFDYITHISKKWRKYPHMIIGKRLIGQIHTIPVPPYTPQFRTSNGMRAPVTINRKRPDGNWINEKVVMDSISCFVHQDEDTTARLALEKTKHMKDAKL